MQKLAIVLFAAALLLKPVFPVVEYVVNYNYIVENLCINKDNEKLHCNGKCHLKSKLADASDTSEKNLPEKKPKLQQTENLFFIDIVELQIPQTRPVVQNAADRYSVLYSYSGCKPFFHPPSLT